MCKAKIVGRCPSIEAPLNEGLTWKILRSKVAVLYPTFMKHAQAALNAPGNVQHAMGEFVVLKEVANKAVEQMTANIECDVNWRKINNQIAVQKTTVEAEGIANLSNFVRKWGGGTGMVFVDMFHVYHMLLGKIIGACIQNSLGS